MCPTERQGCFDNFHKFLRNKNNPGKRYVPCRGERLLGVFHLDQTQTDLGVRGLDSVSGKHSLIQIGNKIFSTAIFSLPLI